MDDDTAGIVIFVVFMLCLIGAPFVVITTVFSCIACSRTRKWKKEKAQRARAYADTGDLEGLVDNEDDDADSLLDEDSTSESESESSTTAEERAKAKAQREEDKQPDWDLTTGQKFRKEMKKAWKGSHDKEAAKKKERKERRKMAKAVAVEMKRMERKKAKKAKVEAGEGSSSVVDEDGLPSYKNATAATVEERKR